MKLTDEKIGKKVLDMSLVYIFLDRIPKAQATNLLIILPLVC